ncbi:MAG: glycosyltransferase family 4 protein [Alistipes sp.]|nr:glycosyltransferase family 4 protein [Alistipes senegalensis]MCM1251171.1 glycosyltransferase family 4 protein [Alistipes sp.]
MSNNGTILQIFASPVWGGGEQFVADLSRRLLADGRRVVLVSRRSRAVADRAADLGAPLHRLPLKGFPDLLSALLLARLVLRYRPETIHVHHFKDAFTALYARAVVRLFGMRPRIVLTRHLVRPGKRGPLHDWMYRRLDRVAFVSELARRTFFSTAPALDRDRTVVIRNSSPLGRSSGDAFDLRERYGIAPGVPVLLFCGRLVPEKGCDVLLRACARLGGGRRYALFFVGGADDENYLASLRRLAAGLAPEARVEFVGFVDGASAWLAQADLCVQPSVVAEAGSLTVIEAMQAGCAVVATDNGSQPEYIASGTTGLLVPPGDDKALAAAIARLTDDAELRRSMGAAARQYFDRHLSYEHFYRKYLALYDR